MAGLREQTALEIFNLEFFQNQSCERKSSSCQLEFTSQPRFDRTPAPVNR